MLRRYFDHDYAHTIVQLYVMHANFVYYVEKITLSIVVVVKKRRLRIMEKSNLAERLIKKTVP